jgi:hemoglobin
MDDPVGELYRRVGEESLRAMVAAFYRRVREDELVGGLYPDDDWEGAERRLLGFLLFRFGGPTDYVDERGHPRLRGRHMPFAIGEAERDRWVEMMAEAMGEVGIGGEEGEVMGGFFIQVADFMRNR